MRAVDHAGYPKIPSSGGIDRAEWSDECNKLWHIEEKIDGSQLSFYKSESNGEITFMNRGGILKKPYGWMFDRAISALTPIIERYGLLDTIYHGECITKPKHNVIQYGRVPKFYFVLFDIQDLNRGNYIDRVSMEVEAHRIGFECVQCLFRFSTSKDSPIPREAMDELLHFIENGAIVPMLGGAEKPEGIVFKCHRFTKRGQNHSSATKIKIVRKEFKEKHAKPNKLAEKQVITAQESIDRIMSWYSVEARWIKATQRLRDQGVITGLEENTVKERNKIMDEARRDFLEEEEETLKGLLWAEFGQTLVQRSTEGK